jgi:hypothetical protein
VIASQLEALVGKKLQVKINNNRSTMLRVRWGHDCTKVSLHRIFQTASPQVQEALARYLRRDDKRVSPVIKAFIAEHSASIDGLQRKKPLQLISSGEVYDLEAIYREINSRYFGGELNLSITWFGSFLQKNRTRCSLGLYCSRDKLVKVNRLLDTIRVPLYVIEYIVYHEMVHAICPGSIDARGFHRVHDKQFKLQEQKFCRYREACQWIKQHRQIFFGGILWQDIASGQISNIGRTKRTLKKASSLLARLKRLLTP